MLSVVQTTHSERSCKTDSQSSSEFTLILSGVELLTPSTFGLKLFLSVCTILSVLAPRGHVSARYHMKRKPAQNRYLSITLCRGIY